MTAWVNEPMALARAWLWQTVTAMCLTLAVVGCTQTPPKPNPAPTGTGQHQTVPTPPTGVLAFDCAPPPGTGEAGTATAADTLCTASPGGPLHRVSSPALAALRDIAAVFPQWSPEGRRLLIRLAQSRGGTQLDDIGMVDADGSGFVNLTNHPQNANWGATWSPDGTEIVFNSGGGQPGQRLWLMNADGSDLRKITAIWGEYPEWSPDGRSIAFMSNRCGCNGPTGAESDIYTIRRDGTELRRLTSWPGEEGVGGWSSDSRWIAYSRNPDQNPGIWIVSAQGGHSRQVLPRARGAQLRGTSEWAPNGSFLMNGLEGSDPQISPEDVYWVSADGRAAIKLFEDADGAVWRPSGSGKSIAGLSLTHRWVMSGGGDCSKSTAD